MRGSFRKAHTSTLQGSLKGLGLLAALTLTFAFGRIQTADAATYYVTAQPSQNVGADGSTNMTSLADRTVTGGGSNQNRAYMSTTAPSGSTRYRISEGSTDTRSNQEFLRAYTPAYATATTIAANATAYADFYMRSTGSAVTARATLYEYNDATGIVGSAKGAASYTGSASSSSRQSMNNVSFGNAAFTVASGNRLLVIFSFDMTSSRPAYLWGQGSSSTPSGNQRITVTETTSSCTVNAATVTLAPASQTITTNGGSAAYSATIRNNDSGAGCASVTYTLAASDSNSTNFNASTLGSSSVTLAAGATSSAIALTVSAISGQTAGTDTTTVTASAAGHANGTGSVNTTLSVSASCTVAAPTLQIVPASQTVAPAGTAGYTVTVTNNDSAACTATSFNLAVAGDTNSADFAAPSTLAPVSLSLNPGQSGTSTLSVTARSTAANNASNSTAVQASAAGHTAPPNVSVTTTVSAATPTTSALLHNSANLGSSKWSGQGGWGVAGGVYGEFGCETCHTKGATNIKGIKQALTVPDTSKGNIPGSSVIFSRVSGSAAAYAAGQGVFGDDTSCSNPAYTTQSSCTANGGTWSARIQSDRVCEVCHTITSYHRYNTAADPDGAGALTAQTTFNHNNATDCTACHPHSRGFKGAGDCYSCHLSAQAGTRRAVVNDSTGGDFRKTSHHVTDGTTNQIANKDVCLVCHGDVLADKGHPGTHPTDPAVDLKDPDSGAYVAADETGIELFCSKCHDANGATRTGLPAGASATRPFNLTSMTVKDTNTPANIGWTAAQQAHSFNSANSAGGCLACHGNAAAAGTTLDAKKNAHGSDQTKMMQFAYSAAIAAYPVNNTSNFCYNCHGTTAANGAVNNVGADFAKTNGHKTVTCADCHEKHQARAGNHTAGSATLAGVLNGATGKGVTTWNSTNWGGVSSYAAIAPATTEWQVCFKCHSGASLPAGTGAAAYTDLGLEFSPNNASGHPIAIGLNNYPNSTAPKALTAAKMKAPWNTNLGTQTMTCSDCHATDSTASKGPHGSAVKWMLAGTNKAWPYTAASANGTQTGTLFRVATYSTGNGTVNGLFCLNCHTVTGTNNWHSNGDVSGGQHGGNTIMACANCHIRVPHGGKVSRLLQTTNAPARYKANAGGTALGTYDFWGGSAGIKGSTMTSSNFNSSCSRHNSGTGEAW